ncbi:MAG: L-seryl-tRNA(Sec) selenium transferase [Pseudomonadales bacterium]
MQLRDLPGIDALLQADPMRVLRSTYGTETVKQELRALQARWRAAGSAPDWAVEPSACANCLQDHLATHSYRAVFNLTGTLIHTNLGRAPLPGTVLDAVRALVTGPMNLEYDLGSGRRGHRDDAVARRLCLLTGAEAATVVNNCAAALLLVLNTFAVGRQVPVSRGELIEIGGSFRLPEIMERAGCRLREVGTTNRTHPRDYAAAAADGAAMLLKVHPSNYHLSGFTRSVSVTELAAVARDHDLPLAVDLGSGTLVDLTRFGLPHEPMPQEVLNQGADLVMFSGDKLLGSVQAGILVGSRRLIDACNANPMKRALRPDKLTLTILERTLALYEEPEQLPERLPLLRMMTEPLALLSERAESVRGVLAARRPDLDISVQPSDCQIGSGSLPEHRLPSIAVCARHASEKRLRALLETLRALPTPIIGRLQHGALWLDMRGAGDLGELLKVLDHLPART